MTGSGFPPPPATHKLISQTDKSVEENALPAPLSPDDRLLTSIGIGLPELETFLAVVSEGSFSQAARRLNLSQPAVTARVQKLEQMLDVRLLNRTTRRIEPTAAGTRLADEAGRALQGLHRLVTQMLVDSGKARRRVTVAATPMVAALLLPGMLQKWHAECPDIAVVMRDLRHFAALESLDRGECDLAVLALDEPLPRFRFELLMDDEVVALAPEGHVLATRGSITLAELASHPVMILEQYVGILAQIEQACTAQGLHFAPSAAAANLQTILGMVDAGAALAVLPRVMAGRSRSEPRHCLAIEGVTLRRRYGVLTLRERRPSMAALSFSEFLRAQWLGLTNAPDLCS